MAAVREGARALAAAGEALGEAGPSELVGVCSYVAVVCNLLALSVCVGTVSGRARLGREQKSFM